MAFEVARALAAPLEVVVVRKLGLPRQPELAMGAVGEAGTEVLNEEVLELAGVGEEELSQVAGRERAALVARAEMLRAGRPPRGLEGRHAVVVDDGIATGSSARVACEVARRRGASAVTLATPVAPLGLLGELGEVADELVCLEAPEPFLAVGQWYRDFTQVSDQEVVELLQRATAPPHPGR